MNAVRHHRLIAAVALAWLGAVAPLRASPIHEPNNSPGSSFKLPAGQTIVTDDLNGNVGRPDTILGHFDSSYNILKAMSDNEPGVGNGFGSKLTVPVSANGSVYFAVTGAPDTLFEPFHSQFGKYKIDIVVYSPSHDPVKSLHQADWVEPDSLDIWWFDPDDSIDDWTDYTAEAIVNNVEGPGSGDSLDFFTFTGLVGGQSYTVDVIDAEFDTLIGWYEGNTRIASAASSLSVTARPDGTVKIGVTGAGDTNFIGQHALVGEYTLTIVPEPQAALLLAMGATVMGLYGVLARRRRRNLRATRA